MSRRLSALCAALLAAVLLAACGGTRTVTRTVTVPQKITTAPPSQAPETSIRPEGPGIPSRAEPPVGRAVAASVQMRLSTSGLRMIEGNEGFAACPYPDAAAGWAIPTRGFGETEGIHRGSPCVSRAFAESNLSYRFERYYAPYIRALHVTLSQPQFDALGDLIWNTGPGVLGATTLGYHLRHREWPAAANSMLQYVHAGGIIFAGLVTRRRAEVRLFLTPTAHLTAAQLHARRLSALHVQEGLRRALHADIERHHCRPGQHATPRRYHTLCGRWLREGQHTIRLINHYRGLLHLARVSSVHRPVFNLVPVPRTARRVTAAAASAVTVSPVPHGPSGSWAVEYADGFTAPLGSTDTTWRAHEHNAGCCSNSNEIMDERPSKVRQGAAGLELLCSKEETTSGKPYTCGGVSTSAFRWRPGQGQTLAFEAVMQLPPRDLGEDPGWWSTDTVWTDEIDFLEAWEWGHVEYYAGIPCWLPKAGGGSDFCHEIYSAQSELHAPESGLHTYTSVVKPNGEIEEYVDGAYRWKLGPISGINTPLMSLILTHALRQSSNLTGTNSFTIRSVAVYEDSAHKGVGIEGAGVAPGTTLGGSEPAPEPTPTTTTETTPAPPPPTVPATPTGCTAATHREGATSWLTAACSPSSSATSYTLWRTEATAKSSTAKPGEAWTTGSTSSFSNHLSVKQGERYCFREAAVNASGQSAPSPDFCVTA